MQINTWAYEASPKGIGSHHLDGNKKNQYLISKFSIYFSGSLARESFRYSEGSFTLVKVLLILRYASLIHKIVHGEVLLIIGSNHLFIEDCSMPQSRHLGLLAQVQLTKISTLKIWCIDMLTAFRVKFGRFLFWPLPHAAMLWLVSCSLLLPDAQLMKDTKCLSFFGDEGHNLVDVQ